MAVLSVETEEFANQLAKSIADALTPEWEALRAARDTALRQRDEARAERDEFRRGAERGFDYDKHRGAELIRVAQEAEARSRVLAEAGRELAARKGDLDFTLGQLRGALDVLRSSVEIDRERLTALLRAIVPRLDEILSLPGWTNLVSAWLNEPDQ